MYIDIQDGTGTAKNPKYRVALNAATADVAQKLLTENVGSSTRPVYFDGGIPVECVDFLPLTAGPDKKLTGPLGLKKDIGYGTELPEDGFEGQVFFLDDQTPDLPLGGTTGQVLVKNSNDDKDASWTSEFTGNAASANMLNSNAGSGDKPVYFDGGVPVACDDTLNISVKGSAAKWTTARNFTISDGTNTGSAVSVDGTKAITLTLPTTIKATLKGNADTATNASAADKLNSDAGSGAKPVYFDGGVPVECGDTLGVNITGSAPKWTTARNFTISDGTNTGTPSSVDGSNNVTIKLPTTIKATLKGNADTATNANAADKLNSSNGSSTVPVYFDEGLPVPCDSLSLNTTGSAAKWTNQVNFTISSSDGTGTGAVSKVDGSANVNIKLPATIKADLTGTASEATHAVSADRLGDLNAGFAHTPIYFDNGVPTNCTSPLMLDTSGNAATATKWQEDRTFVVTDADGTHSGENATVNGTEDITLTLPAEIKATLKGTADLARALTENAGSSTRPVYFDGGIPTNCDDTLDVSITGNANTATTASKLSVNAGSAIRPVYFVDGIPKACTSLDLNTTGNAATATVASKLSVAAAGDTNTPVYFVDGVPKACTSLDLSTSGNAGSANKLNTSAGDAETPVYFENGIPKACTGSYLPLSAGPNKKLTGPLGLTEEVMYGDNLPEEGFDGQLFFMMAEEDGPSLPVGGTAGQYLIKVSEADGDATWGDLPSLNYLPLTGGTVTGDITAPNFKGTATNATNINSSASTSKAYVLGTTSATSGNKGTVYNASVYTQNSVLYGAAWNDYAEYRQLRENDNIPYGRVVIENGDDTLSVSTGRLQAGGNVCSDTFGFAIGETDQATMPIAVAGRVLVYCNEDRNSYEPGAAVCSGPNGTVSKMTREEIKEWPDRIIGYVSAIPSYEVWGENNVAVNGRIWIKIK